MEMIRRLWVLMAARSYKIGGNYDSFGAFILFWVEALLGPWKDSTPLIQVLFMPPAAACLDFVF